MELSYKFYGKHYLASYLDCDNQQINDLLNLKKSMINGIKNFFCTT